MPKLEQGPSLVQQPAPPTIQVTPDEEFTRIKSEQHREQEWWAEQPKMHTSEDILARVESGHVRRLPDVGIGYKISGKVREDFRYLDNAAADLLEIIASQWERKVAKYGLGENLFLVVSSLARTEEFQQQLIEQGYPAVENSTHTKLGAFDIAIQWFEQNRPELLSVLREVLKEMDSNQVNTIEEPTIGALHIAAKPY